MGMFVRPSPYNFQVILNATTGATIRNMYVTKVYPVNREGTLMNTDDKRRMTSYPLRLASSLRDMASNLAQRDGVSLNHFISLAVAEKISRLEAETLNQHKILIRQQKLALASGVISSNLYRR